MSKRTGFEETSKPAGRSAAGIIVAAIITCAGTARGQVFTEFVLPTAGSAPGGIAAGTDGNLWFTEFYFSNSAQSYVSKIGRITTAGVITEFQIPTAAGGPGEIVAGPDGNLWFTELNADKIGRITTAGVITEFAVSGGPLNIAAGPDGNFWFTEFFDNKIGRISPTGVLTEFSIPTADSFAIDIVAGPDGNLWFTEELAGKIGRITPAGLITEFPIPAPFHTPGGIAVGPDGALWFTDGLPVGIAATARRKPSTESIADSGGRIGRITTDGVVSEFEIPTYASGPSSIVAGPDGALWFTESTSFANKIGRITLNGVISEFPVPTPFGTPTSITAGPDGALWFTERIGKIGRITPTGGTCVISLTSLCLNGLRLKVEASWTASDGSSGSARSLPLRPDAGDFWFFSPDNPELLVKALNGCSINGRYWFFAAGLTNVNVVLKVTDTQNGHVITYTNPQGTVFQSILDTNAFPCSP